MGDSVQLIGHGVGVGGVPSKIPYNSFKLKSFFPGRFLPSLARFKIAQISKEKLKFENDFVEKSKSLGYHTQPRGISKMYHPFPPPLPKRQYPSLSL